MKKQQGFTLIELVIVVIILGFLGAAAVPRFLDVTDDAKDSSVEGVAGGFASAVGLVRAEWELAGRPADNTDITYDGIAMDVTDTGYPSSLTDNRANAAALEAGDCQQVFSNILQSAPTSVLAGATGYKGERYVVRKGGNLCQYILAENITIASNTVVPANYVNNAFATPGRQGFTYNADTGAVVVVKN